MNAIEINNDILAICFCNIAQLQPKQTTSMAVDGSFYLSKLVIESGKTNLLLLRIFGPSVGRNKKTLRQNNVRQTHGE